MDAPDTKSLPENAYRPLAAGETYAPMIPAPATYAESTARSVGWGLFLCVIFTIASAYSGLKVGQGMGASIPISILAIGLARVYRRRSTLLENVILTNIGGTSGAIVAGYFIIGAAVLGRIGIGTSTREQCQNRKRYE